MEDKLNEIKIISQNKDVNDTVNSIIIKNAKESNNVKDVIDLAATSKALQDDKIVGKIVDEKQKELLTDAEKKKIEAETDKIRKEAEKVKQETEKEIAELEKTKNRLEGEIANLNAESDKAQAFFDSNKSILKCIGIREKLSLNTMQVLIIPSGIVFTIFQIILLPFSLIGYAIESLMNIVDIVCGKIAKGGLKIALSILVAILIVVLLIGCYYIFTNYVIGKIIE